MRRSLTSKELKTLEKVSDETDKEFLRNIWLNGEKHRSAPSMLLLVLYLVSAALLYGLLGLTGGLHNVAVFFTVTQALWIVAILGIVTLFMFAFVSDGKTAEQKISSAAEIRKLIEGKQSMLSGSKIKNRLGILIDIAFWAALVYTGHVFLALLVMAADITARMLLGLIRATLLTKGLSFLREVTEEGTI